MQVSPTSIVVANCGDCRCAPRPELRKTSPTSSVWSRESFNRELEVLAEQGTARDLSSDHNVQSATQEVQS